MEYFHIKQFIFQLEAKAEFHLSIWAISPCSYSKVQTNKLISVITYNLFSLIKTEFIGVFFYWKSLFGFRIFSLIFSHWSKNKICSVLNTFFSQYCIDKVSAILTILEFAIFKKFFKFLQFLQFLQLVKKYFNSQYNIEFCKFFVSFWISVNQFQWKIWQQIIWCFKIS